MYTVCLLTQVHRTCVAPPRLVVCRPRLHLCVLAHRPHRLYPHLIPLTPPPPRYRRCRRLRRRRLRRPPIYRPAPWLRPPPSPIVFISIGNSADAAAIPNPAIVCVCVCLW